MSITKMCVLLLIIRASRGSQSLQIYLFLLQEDEINLK